MTAATPIPTRAAGLARLRDFLPRAGRDYAERRNFDLGPEERRNVSGLSPHLRHRLVAEWEVVGAAVAAHGLDGAETFIREQVWRTYWKGWLELRPEVWTDWQAGTVRANREIAGDRWRADTLDRALAGRTGIDCFDAWVAELTGTGYLHNHARMWFASIWIFTLRLPWELGAAFFLRHLLDGDPASNTLSWRWVAGLQTVGKTYLARRENIGTFTGGRFDPVGLAEAAPPLDGPPPPPPRPLAAPAPPDPEARTGLLLHEDDLLAESLGLPPAVTALAALPAEDALERSPAVLSWVSSALEDGAQRAGRHLGLDPVRIGADRRVAACVDWARAAGLRQVVTAAAPVGPVAERLRVLGAALGDQGIALVQVRRPYDAFCWPQATRGFFAFRKIIPDLVRRLEDGMA